MCNSGTVRCSAEGIAQIFKMSPGGRASSLDQRGALFGGLHLLIRFRGFRASARREPVTPALKDFEDPEFWRP